MAVSLTLVTRRLMSTGSITAVPRLLGSCRHRKRADCDRFARCLSMAGHAWPAALGQRLRQDRPQRYGATGCSKTTSDRRYSIVKCRYPELDLPATVSLYEHIAVAFNKYGSKTALVSSILSFIFCTSILNYNFARPPEIENRNLQEILFVNQSTSFG